jgi:hypothetical protein
MINSVPTRVQHWAHAQFVQKRGAVDSGHHVALSIRKFIGCRQNVGADMLRVLSQMSFCVYWFTALGVLSKAATHYI